MDRSLFPSGSRLQRNGCQVSHVDAEIARNDSNEQEEGMCRDRRRGRTVLPMVMVTEQCSMVAQVDSI